MKIKNVLLASLLVGASLFGSSAFALGKNVTVNLAPDGDGGYNAHFGNNFSGLNAGSLFSDFYNFELTSASDSSGSITSSYLKSSTVKDLLITGFTLLQYDPVSNAVIKTYAGVNTTAGGLHPTDNWELSAMGLGAGKYAIEVDGQVVGNGGGSYGSDLTIAITAVPEPETYGMMFAGLALLGVVARRKQNTKA
ncbi:hypothetical protein Jab_1c25090 [Janthinobacterium sp. HH01]|uniref:FxDxF family PEP-CTERM protein n=1 Tax=Janthinobacterium sp. HH01 TaxID=1198452 RepID=UPI0002AEB395|nr:FxDxF family PEP-CTERM protein [Janthinobacterium sp. HH01]ELX13869.1 hypothetical protein Jab_1c25090 [Janthinobacterium sp. HH01]